MTKQRFAPQPTPPIPLPTLLKGQPVQVYSNQTTVPTGPIPVVDTRGYNAVSVQVFITGTTPSVTINIEGATHDGGPFLLLADPNATATAITVSKDVDCIVGEPFCRVNITAISGTFASGQGITVWVTPFVMPGQPIVSIASVSVTADQNLRQINGATLNLGQAAMTASLPVVIANNQSAVPTTNGNQDGAYVAPESTAVVAKGLMVFGWTNDGTPAAEEIPLGPDGRTVIVEGFAGAVPQPVIGATSPAAQNVASLPTLSAPEALHLTGTIALAAASSGSSAVISLIQAGGAVFDARLAVVTLTNTTGQIVNAASLTLTETLNTVAVTDTYNAVGVSVPITTGSQRLLIPLPYGVSLANLQLNVTLAGAVTGNVGWAITLLGPTAPLVTQQLPVTFTITASVASTQIIAAPGAGLRLYVRGVMLSNTSGTLTLLTLQEGSGGTARYSAALAASAGGVVLPFAGWWALPLNTGLFAQCGTSVTDVRVNVTDYLIAP